MCIRDSPHTGRARYGGRRKKMERERVLGANDHARAGSDRAFHPRNVPTNLAAISGRPTLALQSHWSIRPFVHAIILITFSD